MRSISHHAAWFPSDHTQTLRNRVTTYQRCVTDHVGPVVDCEPQIREAAQKRHFERADATAYIYDWFDIVACFVHQ